MPIVMYSLSALGTALVVAYTRAFQSATLHWGKALCPSNPLLPRGMQDAITPPLQTLRNVLSVVLLAAVPITGLAFFRWHTALSVFVLMLLIQTVLRLLMPRPDSRYFLAKLESSLRRRKYRYEKARDELRLEAIDEVISRLDQLKQDEHCPGEPRNTP